MTMGDHSGILVAEQGHACHRVLEEGELEDLLDKGWAFLALTEPAKQRVASRG
jgi:hypothetical protein